ncbi:MAG: metallophosphoesterase family protein, partial [Natronomonas sp.]|nr:metallophosphoesterase family protein [Natronomonas sp.]
MTPSFHPDVKADHLRVDLSGWADVYVVGDVHGCADALDRLLSVLDVTDEDLVLFVGDLIRKGPDSAGVVRRVRAADNMRSVRGNNEEKVLRGEKTVPGLDDDDLTWLRSLPVAISWDGGLIVHGGVDPLGGEIRGGRRFLGRGGGEEEEGREDGKDALQREMVNDGLGWRAG